MEFIKQSIYNTKENIIHFDMHSNTTNIVVLKTDNLCFITEFKQTFYKFINLNNREIVIFETQQLDLLEPKSYDKTQLIAG
jgi:hypothetical protein